MPAKSKAQQKLFGIALAVRRGELKRDDVDDEVLNIVDSDMTDKDIEDFASTKHKGLKEYIKESILDDEDIVFNDDNIKLEIEKFIKDNYKYMRFTISNKPNKDGKFIVDGNNIRVTNNNIISLINELFVWGEVGGYFDCSDCDHLTSLKGAPKEVSKGFYCNGCDSLKSLEGAPEKVGGYFNCNYCDSLTSLKGAPKEVGGDFDCSFCDSLKSLEGAPKEVGGFFDCSHCKSLKSLNYLPKHILGDLFIINLSIKNININHIKSLVHIKGNIFLKF